MIRGYHEYKSIWLNLVNQPEELLCEQEIRNVCETYVVAVRKTIDQKIKKLWTSKRKLAKFFTVRYTGLIRISHECD